VGLQRASASDGRGRHSRLTLCLEDQVNVSGMVLDVGFIAPAGRWSSARTEMVATGRSSNFRSPCRFSLGMPARRKHWTYSVGPLWLITEGLTRVGRCR
jgi:hypothetical protein